MMLSFDVLFGASKNSRIVGCVGVVWKWVCKSIQDM